MTTNAATSERTDRREQRPQEFIEKKDVEQEMGEVQRDLAVQAATQAGALATQAAAQAGALATQAAADAGAVATLAATQAGATAAQTAAMTGQAATTTAMVAGVWASLIAGFVCLVTGFAFGSYFHSKHHD